MQIKTVLNNVYKFKSFVYGDVRANRECTEIEVDIHPRTNGHPICSCCGKEGPIHQTSIEARRFTFIPLWNIKVYFVYHMRRVNCSKCGVKVEKVPWAEGKSHTTEAFQCFLASWAKLLSWSDVAKQFKTSWDNVYLSVKYVVKWGLANRILTEIKSIGIDEVSWRIGHTYLTLVYQIDSGSKRLLWIGKDRSTKTLLRFFRMFGKERSSLLLYVCSDMWKPYLKVIKKKAVNAINILDRFHIMQKINKAIDVVRAEEHKKITDSGQDILKNSRWCLLKRKENLTEKQDAKLKELLKYNLKSVRAYLLKEDFQGFWEYVSKSWADTFLKRWINRVMKSKIEPMKKVALTLRRHKELILNWFKVPSGISTGIVEGFNNKIKVTMRKSYGFKTFECAEIQLYHVLGDLPVPILTHKFS